MWVVVLVMTVFPALTHRRARSNMSVVLPPAPVMATVLAGSINDKMSILLSLRVNTKPRPSFFSFFITAPGFLFLVKRLFVARNFAEIFLPQHLLRSAPS
jgi:hypothetical protein